MVPSEEFMRHAAECEYMAKFSRDPESRKVWNRMAERWVRCAELARQQDPSARGGGRRKLNYRKPAPAWAN
jgi:hypothetical protein